MKQYGAHYSVLKNECLSYLASSEGKGRIFADLTFGAGGHSFAIVNEIENSFLFSCDQDPDAIANGRKNITEAQLDDRLCLIKCNFENFPTEVVKFWEKVQERSPSVQMDGILMDLGVSSHQFDAVERGFSFRNEAPLDMRMDYADDNKASAADVVNNYSYEDLEEIIRDYGEERFSRQIAERICETRTKGPIRTTKDLEDIIFHAYPKKLRFGKTHPATKTFQALRIFVNRELEVLEKVLPLLTNMLAPGGVLCVISFHSLEDRIVKHSFKSLKKEFGLEILTKKPIIPTDEEISENKRSRSAKLRVIRKSMTTPHPGRENGRRSKKNSQDYKKV